MPGIAKLSLDEALDDAPQTRSLLGVFEKDAKTLHKYTATMHQLCSRILNSQREMCDSTQALSAHLKSYEKQNFALDHDDSILSSTLVQFSTYLDEMSSLHQILATQLGDSMMYPLNKFMQADLDEIVQMTDRYHMTTNDHEQSLMKYMKFSKKKENDQKAKQEVDEDLFVYRRKFHQTALHLFSSHNALQYKRKTSLLEPLIGYMQAQKSFCDMSKQAVVREDIDEFLSNISASILGVQAEMNEETRKTVDDMECIERASVACYHGDAPPDMPYIPPNLTLSQKAGYLCLRSKQGLIATKWERCYFFIQGGNLMCQQRDEVAGGLVLDLNLEGTVAEACDIDDRRCTFHVISPKLKKTVLLQAENLRERDEWIATINNVVLDGGYVTSDRAKERSPPQSLPLQRGTPPPSLTSPSTATIGSPRDMAVGSRTGPSPTQPSTPAESGFFPDAPISFDLVTPTEQHRPFQAPLDGPPKRINPFDEAADVVVTENITEDTAFCQTFNVNFLGSMAVRTDRGEQLVHETIRQIMAARAIHNVFKMTESLLVVSNQAIRLVDPASKSVRSEFLLEDISFWAVHKENKRLFGFISRTRAGEEGGQASFSCHVFECNTTGEEICQAIHQATKVAYQVLMRSQAVEEQKFIEEQILLANIQQMEDLAPGEGSVPTSPVESVKTGPDAAPILSAQTAEPYPNPAETKGTESSGKTLQPQMSEDGKFVILAESKEDESIPQAPEDEPSLPEKDDKKEDPTIPDGERESEA